MNPKQAHHVALAAVAVLALSAALAASAEDKPANPVQIEMRLLEKALQDSVSAVAAGDVRGLPKKLHAVHTAAGDTGKALKDGSYKPPQGADRIEAFIALDEEFHREMIKMVKAAKKNDVPTTAAQLGVLMARCHGCHAQFRAPVKLAPTGKGKARGAGR
jgi:cytochrome c556